MIASKPSLLLLVLVSLGCAKMQAAVANADTPRAPVVAAVREGKCAEAVELVNKAAADQDARTLFWGARMLDEGICVQESHQEAAAYYAQAAQLGDADAALERAALTAQEAGAGGGYEAAGGMCKSAGLAAVPMVGNYTLGYVCTLRTWASRYVREKLPAHPFVGEPTPLRVEFRPRTGDVRVVSVPHVALQDQAPTGSHRARSRVDIRRLTVEAWNQAVARAPKPDPAGLEDQAVTLELDVDLALEAGAAAADASPSSGLVFIPSSLMQGRVHPVGSPVAP